MYDEKRLKQMGSSIKLLRLTCKISQQKLAEQLGISQTHMSNIEANRVQLSLKLLLRIANVSDCCFECFWDVRAAVAWAEAHKYNADNLHYGLGYADSQTDASGQRMYSLEEVRQLLTMLDKTKLESTQKN